MRIIITGGTGLIGRALTADLTAAGREVVILSRSPQKHKYSLPDGVRLVGWNGRDGEGWVEWADGAAAIVNLAGESIAGEGFPPERWSAAKKERILKSRVQSGAAVVDAIRQTIVKPAALIQSSAVGYYGSRDDEKLTEQSAPGADFLADVCVQWEDSTAAVEQWGVRRAILRTGLVLAKEGGALPSMTLPFKLFAGGPLGDGRQYWPWIHIADEIAAIRYLIDNALPGPFNLTAPNPLTNKEFSKTLGAVMGRPSIMPAPAFALRLAMGEVATILLDGQRAVPQALLDAGFKFQYPELQPALTDLL
jgi:uncharacterized protein (TIGR01777 family)